jgi:hypothetical protein
MFTQIYIQFLTDMPNHQLFGHIANYQSRGTYHATEQVSLYGAAPRNFRDYYTMAEYDIDLCVPSTMLVAHMLKSALVWTEREPASAAANTAAEVTAANQLPVIWIMRMAPRRWFALDPAEAAIRWTSVSPSSMTLPGTLPGPLQAAAAVEVTSAWTRVGILSFKLFPPQPAANSSAAAATTRIEFTLSTTKALVGEGLHTRIRMRYPTVGYSKVQLSSASMLPSFVDSSQSSSCPASLSVDHVAQTVDVEFHAPVAVPSGGALRCAIAAHWLPVALKPELP